MAFIDIVLYVTKQVPLIIKEIWHMKISAAFFTCVLFTLFLVGCGEESTKTISQNKGPVANKQSTMNNNDGFEQKETKSETKVSNSNVWPYIDADDHGNDMVNNLTAKNYVLIFDGSGSMRDSGCSAGKQKIDVAKEAVMEWSKTLPLDANLGLVAFHNGGWSHEELTSGQRDTFIKTVQDIIAGGRTPLTNALKEAYKNLTKQALRQLGYGEYTIVVVTDGIANNGDFLYKEVNKVLSNSPINIYTIGFCIGSNHSLNQKGQTIYKAADNPAELREGLKEVFAESDAFDDTSFNEKL